MADNGRPANVQPLIQPARRGSAAAMVETPLRDAMSQFATGVTVLSAAGPCGHAMTANAFTSVSLEPPLVLICVASKARFHESVLCARSFGVSMLAADQQDLSRYFADRRRPHGLEQFDAVDWTPGPHTGAPLLVGALAWLECSVVKVLEGGDHSMFLGKVLSASRGPDRRALLFYSGGYHEATPPARSA
jgi:flavin reductase